MRQEVAHRTAHRNLTEAMVAILVFRKEPVMAIVLMCGLTGLLLRVLFQKIGEIPSPITNG